MLQATEPGTSSVQLVHGEREIDQTHALMAEQMLAAKRSRLKVELDREALANRISRLKAEEMRATKRIEQTHRRTQDIVAAKDRHQSDLTFKEQVREENEALVAEHREYLRQVRVEQRKNVERQKEAAANDRQANIRASKESAARNAEAIAHNRAAELNHAMFKRNEVRRVEADARERKLREKELMIAHLQQRAEERHDEETRQAEDLERQLVDLERQEYELLVALEGHKAERASVYAQLEESLGPTAMQSFSESAPVVV